MSVPQIDDGGPAFPSGKSETPGYENILPYYEGMTLRDWFATHATEEDILAHLGETVHPQTGWPINRRTREAAKYAYADAMIAARKVKARKGGVE